MDRKRRPPRDDRRPATFWRWSAAAGQWLILGLLGLLLSGCLLVSGERTSSDTPQEGGNLSTTFVSAEGDAERVIETGAPGMLNVITIVTVSQGQLQIDMLDPDGSVVYSVQGRPQDQVTKSGNIPTDDEGNLRYRVIARGARSGGFQILYQRAGS